MPRRPRGGAGGLVFHVMNRGARRLQLFEVPQDYADLLRVLREAHERVPLRVLCYVVMPNHWHLVLWPTGDHDLSVFMAWVTATHVRRWHRAHDSAGSGTLYQGRYKAIAVKRDEHLLAVCRYVERNPVRALLVQRPEEWPWSSASPAGRKTGPPLHPWPVARPSDWTARLDEPERTESLDAIRGAIRAGRPCGPRDWAHETATLLGWQTGLRPRGRLRGSGSAGSG